MGVELGVEAGDGLPGTQWGEWRLGNLSAALHAAAGALARQRK